MIKRFMKAVGLYLAAVPFCAPLYAQSTTPVCGGSDKNDHVGSMSYTIGQVDYLYSHSPMGNAVAGVQQPFDDNTAYHTNCDGVELTIYPNPTTENAYVVCDALDAAYPYTVTDMTGKLFLEGHLQGEYTTIPMVRLANGAYLLKIVCGDGKDDYSVFKIIKN